MRSGEQTTKCLATARTQPEGGGAQHLQQENVQKVWKLQCPDQAARCEMNIEVKSWQFSVGRDKGRILGHRTSFAEFSPLPASR
jgi:hypothetical protein